MNRWAQGREYRTRAGATKVCARRWFEGEKGTLEMVELRTEPQPGVELIGTARNLGDVVHPPITETLGGVYRPSACEHLDSFGRVLADAGPHAGAVCCRACGAPPVTGGAVHG